MRDLHPRNKRGKSTSGLWRPLHGKDRNQGQSVRQPELLRQAGLNPPIKHIRRSRRDRQLPPRIFRHKSKLRPILTDLHIDRWAFYQEVQLKYARNRAGLRRELRHSGGANRRLVPQKVHCEIKSALDTTPLWGSRIECDTAAPRAGKKLAVCPSYRIAMQHRTIADDFRKALRIVPDEIDFGEASQFDL